MKTVWKYKLPIQDEFFLELPIGAKSLHFGVQDNLPVLWALVDPTAKLLSRLFRFSGTGHPIDDRDWQYIGTTQFRGDLIFHLFELLP